MLTPSDRSSSFTPIAAASKPAEGLPRLEKTLLPVAPDLLQLNATILDFLPLESRTSREVASHILLASGKRIRPALYFLACRLFGYRGDHYFAMAAAAEFVHTASLLHDDVVDNSPLRRGRPTARKLWGDLASVLVGDLIYARASELMAATGHLEIVETFAQAIRLMSEGELLAAENAFNLQLSTTTYERILFNKTAALLGSSCKTAALLAQTDRQHAELLYEFGCEVGLAFQLIDDALDYTGSEKIFGKKTLADLREGKITMPVILLRDAIGPEATADLQNVIQGPAVSEAALQKVHALVAQYDTTSKTLALAEQHTQKALAALRQLPASAAREHLEELAQSLLGRGW